MSRLFPHSAYAEDQSLSRTILTVHVLSRGLQVGTIAGAIVGTGLHAIRNPTQRAAKPFIQTLLRSSGTGAIIGTACMAVNLPLMMRSKEEIEWQDRTWRLLENKGQLEVDDWSLAGATLALGSAVSVPGLRRLGWRAGVGSTALGSIVGVGGYMIWRHGINGGKWEQTKAETELKL
jgi:hypothetical protein